MARIRWVFLGSALIIGPLLFSLHLISGEMAWVFFLAFAALFVGSLVFSEQGRRRQSPSPFYLGGDLTEEANQREVTTNGVKAPTVNAGARTPAP